MRQRSSKRPMIVIPDWFESESGLLLHNSVFAVRALEPVSQPSAPLPAELRPRPQPIAIAHYEPSFMDQVAMFADEDILELPRSSIEEVRAWVRSVPFEIGMGLVAAIAAKSYGLLGDQARQLVFAERVYGDALVFQKLRAFVRREGPKAQVFAEQHAFILERILIEEARDGVLAREPTQVEASTIARALLGCTSIAGAPLEESTREGQTVDDVMAVLVQNGAHNSKTMLLGEMARVVELYGRIHHHPELLPTTDKICPLDDWMAEDYRFSIDEQLRIGFALGAATQGLADGEDAGAIPYVTPDYLNDLVVKMGLEDRREEFLDLISADRETFRREFAELGTSLEHVAWERRPLMRHPFLRLENGGLLLVSPRAIQSWMGDGFYYRLLAAAQQRAQGDPDRKLSRRFTAYTGQLLEVHAIDLMRSVYPDEKNPISGVHVYGEQPYGPGGQMKTSDTAILIGAADLVLFEVSGARISATTLVSAAAEDAIRDVQKMVIKKIQQLDTCITALRSTNPRKRAQIPAENPEVDMSLVQRIWPLIVTAGNITQIPPFWQHITEATDGKLAQSGVQPLTLLHIEDYEALCYLIENGHGLIEILTAKTQPQFAQRELAIWLRDDPFAPKNISGRPKLVEDAWDQAMRTILAGIDFTKGEQQQPNHG